MPLLIDYPMTARGCQSECACVVPDGVECYSVFDDWLLEAEKHKWIESQKANRDLGEECIKSWVRLHWQEYLRARWIEHIQGTRFWLELDHGDFGILTREFREHQQLLDQIIDRLKSGHENLQIVKWAIECEIPTAPVLQILAALDINSRRLAHRFEAA